MLNMVRKTCRIGRRRTWKIKLITTCRKDSCPKRDTTSNTAKITKRRRTKIINSPSRSAMPTTPEEWDIRPTTPIKTPPTRVRWTCWPSSTPTRLPSDQEPQTTRERTSRDTSMKMTQTSMIFSLEATRRKIKTREVSKESWRGTLPAVETQSPTTQTSREQADMLALAKDAVKEVIGQESWPAGENESCL